MHKTGIETFNRHVATRRFVSIPCTTLKRISTSTRVVVKRKSGESRSERERDRKKERKKERVFDARATKESIPYCLGETAIFYCN